MIFENFPQVMFDYRFFLNMDFVKKAGLTDQLETVQKVRVTSLTHGCLLVQDVFFSHLHVVDE